MNQTQTFLFAMTVTACVTLANRLVIGSAESEIRPLAKSRGVATLDDCQVTGRIESRPAGVFAVFDVDNPTTIEKDITFHYLATRTPPASPFSRMGPRPETVKKGVLELRLKNGRTTEEILIKEPAPAALEPATAGGLSAASATGNVARLARDLSPEIWTLVVSRQDIKGARGWGAVGPSASDALISLDKGEAVLAVTLQDMPTP